MAHCKEKVAKADRRMRVIAGRLVRELLRKLPAESKFHERLWLCLKPVNGEKADGQLDFEQSLILKHWCPIKLFFEGKKRRAGF